MEKKTKKTKYSKRKIVIASYFLCMIVYLSFNFASFTYQVISKNSEYNKLNITLTEMNDEYTEYEKSLNQLQIPEYLAKYAREKYSLSKEDEIIFK